MFAAWGLFVYRFRWLVAAGSVLVFAVFALVAAGGGHLQENDSITTEASRADSLAQSVLPAQPDRATFVLAFTSSDMQATDDSFRSAMEQALAPLAADRRVYSIATPYQLGGNSLVSRDGRSAVAIVTLNENPDQAQNDYPDLRNLVRSDRLTIRATGAPAVASDFDRLTNDGLSRAEQLAIPVSLLILFVAFGSILAGLLPIGIGVMTITAATAITFLIARRWGVSSGATELVALLGLGLAIDYSLFVVSRFREELSRTSDVRAALSSTTATATRSIAFSGLTVIAGLSGLFFFKGTWLGTVVVPMISVVAFAVIFNLAFLTALLAILGRRINWLRLPMRPLTDAGAIWRRIARIVMRRPIYSLIPTLALVGIAALPIFSINLATDHIAMLPTSAESRQGADLIATQFPGQHQSSLDVVVDFSGGSSAADADSRLSGLAWRLGQLQTVTSVSSPVSAGHISVIEVQSSAPERSAEARTLVGQIRHEHMPGASLLVGGATAGDMDRTAEILARVPGAAVVVGLLSYAILFLLLGSAVLPLKAVLTNLLSMTASFGAIVWIFQQGHLSSLLNFTAGPTDPTLPVLLFCLLFGLSMDYEVFLLSRIQEEYRRTGDNRSAVGFGLQRSGRLVSFAALIMVAVFAAFGLSDVVVFKAAGIGAAIAVLVDATLVRGIIVPSLMVLMGGFNWWVPRRLKHLASKFVEGSRPEIPGYASVEQAVA